MENDNVEAKNVEISESVENALDFYIKYDSVITATK